MAENGKTALIFGLDSFTGPYLAEALERFGYAVTGTGLPGSASLEGRALLPCDITRPDAVRELLARIRPDVVAVLAAISFVPQGTDSRIYDINLFGPLHILEALAAQDGGSVRVLIPSTSHVYGNQREGRLDEDTPADPISHYALSKYAMEQMARPYAERLEIVLPRPFNYTGRGQAEQFLIPKLVSCFRRREASVSLGNLDVFRDFSDVRDVARAYALLLTAPCPPRILNIASGEAVSIRDIILQLEAMTGHHPEIHVNPAFVRNNEIHTLCGDNTRLRTLGWERRYSLGETLSWMLA